MNGVILITTYCDSNKKLDVLQESISNLKNISDLHIMIYNHHSIPEYFDTQVNYSIFDFSNPIFKYPEKYLIVGNDIIDDYGYAVLQQWKRGYFFLKNVGYDFIIFINYDVIIDKILIDSIIDKIHSNNGVIFLNKLGVFKLSIACFKTNIDLIFDKITKDNYVDSECCIAEEYFQSLIKNCNCYIFTP